MSGEPTGYKRHFVMSGEPTGYKRHLVMSGEPAGYITDNVVFSFNLHVFVTF